MTSNLHKVKSLYLILLIFVFSIFQSCEFKLKVFEKESSNQRIEVQRYDRLESQYVTTSDFSALQQMNTDYPIETRTLIEDVLKLGEINDPEISHKFLSFYQDSTLQTLISDAESQYANMDDINKGLNEAFDKLTAWVPSIPIPLVYAQIGALDQSIIIGNNTIGISLDKYLGRTYPIYQKYYNPSQLKTMTREYIVPDCVCFYLLSLYPIHNFESKSQLERDLHMWVCNKALSKRCYNSRYVKMIEKFMCKNKQMTVSKLLELNDYSAISRGK